MIKIKLKDALDKQERSLNSLSKATGIRYGALHEMYHMQRKNINLYYLDRIMDELNIKDISEILEKVD